MVSEKTRRPEDDPDGVRARAPPATSGSNRASGHGDAAESASAPELGRERLKSIGGCGSDFGFNPAVDASVEHIQRERAAGEDLVMEGFEVELGA